ncbi:MAG: hypothetical protein EBU92_15880 [Betaproteobacteria bacterium]|jgi:hypothetical protein|nr:hypothetical protein [Betaproteobacteria bacterium]
MSSVLWRVFLALALVSISLESWSEEDVNCKKDNEDAVWCAPEQGGIQQRPNGEVFCGVGQCIKMTNGAVVCSNQPHGRTALNYIGQAVCAGNCVPGKQSLCVKPK